MLVATNRNVGEIKLGTAPVNGPLHLQSYLLMQFIKHCSASYYTTPLLAIDCFNVAE